MSKTCFVVMPIGTQSFNGKEVTELDLKRRYDDLIKEAVKNAYPTMDVVRSDEVGVPGAITTDICTRIMHSDFVLADITFPNVNVYYEIGLRHASRPGTILIRDETGPEIGFDIKHLRHIVYQNSPTGLKKLSGELKKAFDSYEVNPGKPDNQFLETAKLTEYSYPQFQKANSNSQLAKLEVLQELLSAPDVIEMVIKKASGQPVDQGEFMKTIFSRPEIARKMLMAMFSSGELKL